MSNSNWEQTKEALLEGLDERRRKIVSEVLEKQKAYLQQSCSLSVKEDSKTSEPLSKDQLQEQRQLFKWIKATTNRMAAFDQVGHYPMANLQSDTCNRKPE